MAARGSLPLPEMGIVASKPIPQFGAGMEARAESLQAGATYPLTVEVRPATEGRNRWTSAFRFFLAIPHLIFVGGPMAAITSIEWTTRDGHVTWGYGSGGVLSVVAGAAAFVAWFAILFAARHPGGLWKLEAFYLRWRVNAIAYLMLLRDEYPPFGDGPYPATLRVSRPEGPRNRVTVFFRLFLAIPHLLVLAVLGLAWSFTTAVAWAAILVTGRYPEILYGFALGVLAWNVRVEAYLLLMRDEYPPFTLRT